MSVPPDVPRAAVAASGLVPDLAALPPTERRNPRTTDIDLLPTRAVLGLLQAEDAAAASAVRPVLGTLAEIVDEAAERIGRGGRVHYFGAGSSGRIAMLDATELAPTFSLPPDVVVAHLAGGEAAMFRSVEGAEDDRDRGAGDARDVTGRDVVIGLSASGRTPYVAGALSAASASGAYTALITCNPGSPLRAAARATVVVQTGPEAIAGSTRLKATSALKSIVNSFSTALMIRLGKTFSNLMIEVSPSNAKLRARTLRILMEGSGRGEAACAAALEETGGELGLAMVTLLSGAGAAAARQALATGRSVRGALSVLGVTGPPLGPPRGQLVAAAMRQQPAVLAALAARAAGVARLVNRAVPERPAGIVLAGGASPAVGHYGRDLLQAVTGVPVRLLTPGGSAADGWPVGARPLDGSPASARHVAAAQDYRGYLAVVLDGPGATPDQAAVLDTLQRQGAHAIAITKAGSPLALAARSVLTLDAGSERTPLATKTVTAQLLALALLARAFDPVGIDAAETEAVSGHVAAVLGDEPADRVPAALSTARGVVCVARGALQAAAQDTALKITESTAVLAAAYSPRDFQQGWAAALTQGLTVLSFGADQDDPGLAALAAEVTRRGAACFGLSPHPDAAVRLPSRLPGWVLPIVAVVRGQQLALAAALLAGCDPDQPGERSVPDAPGQSPARGRCGHV
ncbi:MAG TPA: N-acetylmuramic acid 6-phosphate etherase [Streptosporangiaceae bacterium]|jgi:N-acetylmuramic acid 6-phosphate etherase|nr:N-acetylmuramic acid 6-phosphate etherase [Streptosporangiaceae bacterium]